MEKDQHMFPQIRSLTDCQTSNSEILRDSRECLNETGQQWWDASSQHTDGVIGTPEHCSLPLSLSAVFSDDTVITEAGRTHAGSQHPKKSFLAFSTAQAAKVSILQVYGV